MLVPEEAEQESLLELRGPNCLEVVGQLCQILRGHLQDQDWGAEARA